jgi:hypothetical protein
MEFSDRHTHASRSRMSDTGIRMSTYPLRRSWLLALSLALLTDPTFSQTSGEARSTNSAPAETTEAARVHAFLDARYKASDVRYSFRTKARQDIDCIDFFAQPGVRELAARGQPLTSIPKPPPLPGEVLKRLSAAKERAQTAGPRPEDEFSFHGQPDVNGKPEQCPEGSVAEVRITAEEIARAGGLDRYIQLWRHKKAPPPITCTQAQMCEYPTFAHVVGTLLSATPGIGYGITVMSIYGPNVPSTAGDHSLSQFWLYSGSNTSVPGPCTAGSCTSDCAQTIELGWDVDPVINPGDQNVPHLFLFSTNNGYENGCYNNVQGLPSTCVTWIGTGDRLR